MATKRPELKKGAKIVKSGADEAAPKARGSRNPYIFSSGRPPRSVPVKARVMTPRLPDDNFGDLSTYDPSKVNFIKARVDNGITRYAAARLLSSGMGARVATSINSLVVRRENHQDDSNSAAVGGAASIAMQALGYLKSEFSCAVEWSELDETGKLVSIPKVQDVFRVRYKGLGLSDLGYSELSSIFSLRLTRGCNWLEILREFLEDNAANIRSTIKDGLTYEFIIRDQYILKGQKPIFILPEGCFVKSKAKG